MAAWCSPAPGQPQRDTAGPRTGFPLLRLGDTASIEGETVFATGKSIVDAAAGQCPVFGVLVFVAVCSAVPGAELCGAVSLVTTPALSLGCQLPLHSPHRHTQARYYTLHTRYCTLYTLDTTHIAHFTHYTVLEYYTLYTTQIFSTHTLDNLLLNYTKYL